MSSFFSEGEYIFKEGGEPIGEAVTWQIADFLVAAANHYMLFLGEVATRDKDIAEQMALPFPISETQKEANDA